MRDAKGRTPPTRVAIIGTGLAGLTTAYLLRQDDRHRYAVTLLEQADSLSFDSQSVAVKNSRTGAVERVDLPMRASAGGYYANLLQMYSLLGIPLHPVRFLFVFAESLGATAQRSTAPKNPEVSGVEQDPIGGGWIRKYFIHASNMHQMPPPWPGTRSVLSHVIEIIYLLVCNFWLTLACFVISPVTAGSTGGETVAQYLDRIWLPKHFVTHYLLPLMSSVSTCTHSQLLDFPASDLVNYKRLSYAQQHYAVCGGVHQVQSRLAQGLDDVRLGCRVSEVIPRDDGQGVLVRWGGIKGQSVVREEVFDKVVLAVSPDVASKIFRPLGGFAAKIPTVQVESTVVAPMTDGDLREKETRYSVVKLDEKTSAGCMHHGSEPSPSQIITLKSLFSGKGSRTEALHTMPSGVVVSTCPINSPSSGSKTLRHARFTRTLRTPESRAVVEKIMGRRQYHDDEEDDEDGWVNGDGEVWLVGSWCWDGMVLLEGCVVSAMQVAHEFGVDIPWQTAASSSI